MKVVHSTTSRVLDASVCHATPSNPTLKFGRFLWPCGFHVSRLSLSSCSCEATDGGEGDPRLGAWPQKRQRKSRTLGVPSEVTNARQSLRVDWSRNNPTSLHSVSWFGVSCSRTRMSCSVCLESWIQHANWGRTARFLKPNRRGFETQAAGDARRKHFLFHAKKLAWMLCCQISPQFQAQLSRLSHRTRLLKNTPVQKKRGTKWRGLSICATRLSRRSGFTACAGCVLAPRDFVMNVLKRDWLIGATRERVDVDHVSRTTNLSMEKAAELPKPLEATMRGFSPSSEDSNSRTQESPQNPEASKKHNPDRLIFSLPLPSQDAARLWACAWHPPLQRQL